jgi:hypothetical protein
LEFVHVALLGEMLLESSVFVPYVPSFVFDQNDQEILWNQSYNVSSRIHNRESMMACEQGCFDVFDCVNIPASNRMSGHNFLSDNLLAWNWYVFHQYWHLFSSDTSIIKTSGEKSREIG